MSAEESKLSRVFTLPPPEKAVDVKKLKKKHREEINKLQHRIVRLQHEHTRYFDISQENVAMANCVLAYRKPSIEQPLYANMRELGNEYFKRGLQQDRAIYPDILNKLDFEVASDLTPLNKKVA